MPIDEAYLTWLYSQIGPDSVNNLNRSRTYWTLLRLLYNKEFTWVIPNDENRAQDGKDLRNEFLRETRTRADRDWKDMPVSFLEVLVALSWKLAFEGGGEQSDRFWELIENLGFTRCTDANPPEEEILDMILDKVMAREYSVNGAGGLFPLAYHKKTDKDQRTVELWYQAQTYLLEQLEQV